MGGYCLLGNRLLLVTMALLEMLSHVLPNQEILGKLCSILILSKQLMETL
uniref:Uncharacterized protein n=1 Tax=Rhizophora mucronata TaxID=61149 RepID=A0A2P2NP02_RHIMU